MGHNNLLQRRPVTLFFTVQTLKWTEGCKSTTMTWQKWNPSFSVTSLTLHTWSIVKGNLLISAALSEESDPLFTTARCTVHDKTDASRSRDYTALLSINWDAKHAVLYSQVCRHQWPCESCVSFTDKSLKLSEEKCVNLVLYCTLSQLLKNVSCSFIITRG